MLSEAATSKYVQAGSLRVHYYEAGRGEPLIFCIGQGAGTSAWVVYHRVVEQLSKQFRCLLIDQPGYGKSDPIVVKGESRSTMYARTVRDVMDALGIDAATIVDMSFGAQTAQALAIDYPGHAKRLVLHASGVGPPMASHAFVAMYAAFADPSLATMRGMMNAFLYNGAQYSDDDLMLQARVDAWISRPELDEARRASDAVQRDLSASLGALTLPILQMHGRNDLIAPLESALRLFNYLPNSRLVLFSQCGHWIPVEKPDEFVRYVTDFVHHG